MPALIITRLTFVHRDINNIRWLMRERKPRLFSIDEANVMHSDARSAAIVSFTTHNGQNQPSLAAVLLRMTCVYIR